MSMYGYEIVQTLIVDIEPDEHVKRAMNEINAGKSNISFYFLPRDFMMRQKYFDLYYSVEV